MPRIRSGMIVDVLLCLACVTGTSLGASREGRHGILLGTYAHAAARA